MFLWSKDASRGWLQQHETNLIARFGNALAIIERPGRKRLLLEVASNSKRHARSLVKKFGGRLEKLPRDWLKRVTQKQRAKPLRIGTRLVIDRLPSLRSGGFQTAGAIWRSPFLNFCYFCRFRNNVAKILHYLHYFERRRIRSALSPIFASFSSAGVGSFSICQ